MKQRFATLSSRSLRSGFDRSTDKLWSEQRLTWQGAPASEKDWNVLPDTMVSVHFREVQRAIGGLLRYRRFNDRTVFVFPGGVPALGFRQGTTETTAGRAVVTLRILGGVLARRSSTYGTLQLGVSRDVVDDQNVHYSAWQVVEDYPSRFLHVSRFPAVGLVAGIAGRIYRAYHAKVSFRSLQRIQESLQESAENE